jgi:hypothetical protein
MIAFKTATEADVPEPILDLTENRKLRRMEVAAPLMLKAHEENARILRFLVNELQGRIEGGKLAALAHCLDRSADAVKAATGEA